MTDSSKKNKEVVTQFYNDVFIGHNLNNLDAVMRDDYIQHNGDCPQGKAGFVAFFKEIFGAVPDFKYTLKKMVAEGDIVMAYSTTTGTHKGGKWFGKKATGNKLSFDVVDIFRVQGGLIAEHWDVADTFGLFSQVGVIEQRLKGQG
jgi:predicted SnoaL-like aldol condensation-catalyzing enzyme